MPATMPKQQATRSILTCYKVPVSQFDIVAGVNGVYVLLINCAVSTIAVHFVCPTGDNYAAKLSGCVVVVTLFGRRPCNCMHVTVHSRAVSTAKCLTLFAEVRVDRNDVIIHVLCSDVAIVSCIIALATSTNMLTWNTLTVLSISAHTTFSTTGWYKPNILQNVLTHFEQESLANAKVNA